mmetsp:Transcript_2110/g.2398  ORF Transcript_2110/g.2398 Transcript_2110/m.2398 type:complete len:189 (-) Transcript_2110:86-652(-)
MRYLVVLLALGAASPQPTHEVIRALEPSLALTRLSHWSPEMQAVLVELAETYGRTAEEWTLLIPRVKRTVAIDGWSALRRNTAVSEAEQFIAEMEKAQTRVESLVTRCSSGCAVESLISPLLSAAQKARRAGQLVGTWCTGMTSGTPMEVSEVIEEHWQSLGRLNAAMDQVLLKVEGLRTSDQYHNEL